MIRLVWFCFQLGFWEIKLRSLFLQGKHFTVWYHLACHFLLTSFACVRYCVKVTESWLNHCSAIETLQWLFVCRHHAMSQSKKALKIWQCHSLRMDFVLRQESFVIKSFLWNFFTPMTTNLLLLYFRSWHKWAFVGDTEAALRAMYACDALKMTWRSDSYIYLWAWVQDRVEFSMSLHLGKTSGKFPRSSS